MNFKNTILTVLLGFIFFLTANAQCVFQDYASDGFEYTTNIAGIIPNTLYHATPQTFCPNNGSSAFYANFQNGFLGEFYNNSFDVCPNASMRFSFWTKDCFDQNNNINFEIRDANGLLLVGPQTVINATNAGWQQIVSPSFTATTSTVVVSMSTALVGGPGNDMTLDDFLFEICIDDDYFNTTNDISICNGSTVNLYDSLLPINLSLAGVWAGPSTLANGALGTFNPATELNGTYSYTLSGIANCPDTINYINAIASTVFDTIAATICDSDSFLFNGNYLNTSGSYTDLIGCNIIRTINLSVVVCSVCAIDLGNDSIVCGPVNYTLDAGNFDEYLWQDGSTNQTFTATATGTYYVQGTNYDLTNLVVNPGFESGNVNFTTDYTVGTGGTFGQITNPGTYAINTSPSLVHNNFPACGDHTSGTGNMMIVNGSNTANQAVWCQNIAINPNTDYYFSIWATSVENTNATNVSSLYFELNGNQIGTNFSPSFSACSWQEYTQTWNSGANTSVDLCIYNHTIAGNNDFAIDDIFFGASCIATDTINITSQTSLVDSAVVNICFGASALIFGNNETQEALYLDTLSTTSGCDSIYLKRYLNVENYLSHTANTAICFGDSVFLQNAWQNSSGTYYDTLMSASTCDSLLTTVLSVSAAPTTTTTNTCSNNIANEGVEIDTVFNSTSGCVIEINIVNTAYQSIFSYNLTPSICAGDSVYLAGAFQTQAGVYMDTVSSVLGCDSIIKEHTLTVNPFPIVNAGNDTTINQGSSATLTASGATNYNWSTNETTATINVSPQSTTTYQVDVNVNGCAGSDSVTVFVLSEDLEILIPTAFTPNGDGLNDVFRIVNQDDFENISIRVYNRWGKIVFASTETVNAWDGKFNGIDQTVENYIYYIEASAKKNQQKYNVSGSVALIR